MANVYHYSIIWIIIRSLKIDSRDFYKSFLCFRLPPGPPRDRSPGSGPIGLIYLICERAGAAAPGAVGGDTKGAPKVSKMGSERQKSSLINHCLPGRQISSLRHCNAESLSFFFHKFSP